MIAALLCCLAFENPAVITSASSGSWSNPTTWIAGKAPGAGDRVLIRPGHVVTFDIRSDDPIRSIAIAGTLRFDPDRDTRLTVGLVTIGSVDDPDMDHMAGSRDQGRGTLEVGSPGRPIARDHSATIRLAPVEGLDPAETPAIVCLGGKIELQGASMNRTWVKLGAQVEAGATSVTLAEPVQGWKAGDRVIVTATRHQFARDRSRTPHVGDRPETEERIIREIVGDRLTLDAPLNFRHIVDGEYRGEVANLSRNVVIESSDPSGNRGHTMIHHGSSGSIAFAELRNLGKRGKLGKYSLHFHQGGDSLRGMSVVGASIWGSANRWITIHGTNALLIRDCVGYKSEGHGFFLEDGTETANILDRNLAVMAVESKPLPGQLLPHDKNEGAGFWWANSANAFTRNVAVECDHYGFFFEPPPTGVSPFASTGGKVDLRTIPFLRFEANEAHAQRRHGFKLGGNPEDESPGPLGGIGPDARHPFLIRDFRAWDSHWGFSPGLPSVLVDGISLHGCDFGFWRPVIDHHAYRKVAIDRTRWPFYAMSGVVPEATTYPAPLDPTDDQSPLTVITRVDPLDGNRLEVRGVSVDDSRIGSVRVNGRAASIRGELVVDWEIVLDDPRSRPFSISASAEDERGNIERKPHVIVVP